jgi:hypothetical protein
MSESTKDQISETKLLIAELARQLSFADHLNLLQLIVRVQAEATSDAFELAAKIAWANLPEEHGARMQARIRALKVPQ